MDLKMKEEDKNKKIKFEFNEKMDEKSSLTNFKKYF